MKRYFLTEMGVYLLVVLFVYTGSSKLLNIEGFKTAVESQPLPAIIKWPVTILLPIIEILMGIGLVLTVSRKIALYASAVLMSFFTLYVFVMLISGIELPCSCGGVIAAMSWQRHLYFNIFFMCLSWWLLYVQNKNKQISTDNRE